MIGKVTIGKPRPRAAAPRTSGPDWLAAPLLASPGAALVGSAGSPALSVTGVAEVIGLAVVVSLAATLLPAVRAARSSTIAALPVPASRRILAALGPRKLEIARERAAGAILLLVTPDYTRAARRILGTRATLVVSQMVALQADAARAGEAARSPLRFLSGVAGYRANFSRMGFTASEKRCTASHSGFPPWEVKIPSDSPAPLAFSPAGGWRVRRES